MGRPYRTETNHPTVEIAFGHVWTIRGSSYQVRFVPQKQTEFEALFEDSWLCLRLICSYMLSYFVLKFDVTESVRLHVVYGFADDLFPLVHPPFEESTRLIPYLKSIRLFYWMWAKGIL